MASTFSPSLRIELIGDGDQSGTWGQTTNNNLGTLIEQAIAGVVTITMVDANYTLSNFNGISDEARNQVIVATGTNNSQRDIIAPLAEKTYIINNNTSGGNAIRIRGSSGSAVTIANGTTAQVYCDGINFFSTSTGTTGNFAVNGNATITGTASVTGAISGTTATFSGAISSVSPSFTGTPTAPTAPAGTNTTQIATTAFVTQNAVLTGSLMMWPTASAPSGYLLCNGATVPRSTYAALFAVIGTTFGSGDGSTTFTLPDYRDRMPIGSNTIAASIGATGGSKDAIAVSHTHTATQASHTHFIAGGSQSAALGSGNVLAQTGNVSSGLLANENFEYQLLGGGTSATVGLTNSVTPAITVASAGSSGTNANMPPYLGINFIIKT